jgi:hypothetical protein
VTAKLRGKKVFVKILTLGEWAPLFSPPFQPYPPLHIPPGVSRGTMLGAAWLGLGIDWHGLARFGAWLVALIDPVHGLGMA